MFDLLRSEFVQSVETVSGAVFSIIPKFIAAALFVLVGWIFGVAVGRVVEQLVTVMKADEWLAKAGLTNFVSRMGYTLRAPALFGWLAKMFFMVIFLVAAFDILGLSQVNVFLTQVLAYIPQVIVAAIILFVASVAAKVMSDFIAGASKALGSHVAQLLGSVSRWAIWTFAVIMALSQLGIAPQYMYTLFAGFVAMLAIAGGLAFGLGGKDAAAEVIKDLRADVREGR